MLMTSSSSCLVTACNALQAQSLALDVRGRPSKVNGFYNEFRELFGLFLVVFVKQIYEM